MKTPPLACLLFGLGLVAGWLGSRSSPDGPERAGAEVSPSPRARGHAARPGSALPADVAVRLAAVQAAPDAAERLRAVIQLAWELPVSEMPRWYEHDGFGLRDSAELGVFYDITRRRWLEEDPEGMMEYAMRKNWTEFDRVAARWARLDPERAVAFLESQKDPEKFRRLRTSMIAGLAESRPDQALALIPTGGREDFHQLGAVFSMLAESSPDMLEAAAEGWPKGLREAAGKALAAERLSRDFTGELDRLLGSPDGKGLWFAVVRDYQLGQKLGPSILQHLDRLPKEWMEDLGRIAISATTNDAERWLAVDFGALGVDEQTAARIRSSALSRIAGSDPEKALAHLTAAGFDGNIHRPAFQRAVMTLASRDPDAARGWLERLPEDDDGFRERLRDELETTVHPPVPEEKRLLESFQELKDSEEKGWKVANEFVLASPAEQREFLKAFDRMSSSEKAAIGAGLLKNGSASYLPNGFAGDLIAAVMTQPPAGNVEEGDRVERAAANQASTLAVRWVLEDPAAAVRWMKTLPAGEGRQLALRNAAAHWSDYDAPAMEAWLSSLPAADREDVRGYLENRR